MEFVEIETDKRKGIKQNLYRFMWLLDRNFHQKPALQCALGEVEAP